MLLAAYKTFDDITYTISSLALIYIKPYMSLPYNPQCV